MFSKKTVRIICIITAVAMVVPIVIAAVLALVPVA